MQTVEEMPISSTNVNEMVDTPSTLSESTAIATTSSSSTNGKVKKYEFSIEEQIQLLVAERQYDSIIELTTDLPYEKITFIIADSMFFANFYTDNVEGCINAVKLLEYDSITDMNISNCDCLFGLLQSKGKKIIATTNVKYEPKEDEIAVYYGSYPISHRIIPL